MLTDTLSMREGVIDAPPVRLDYDDLILPNNVDFTFVAVRHTLAVGNPDYLQDLLDNNDVFILEQVGWTPDRMKRLQRLANGDFKARTKTFEELSAMEGAAPEVAGWLKEVCRQLYSSRVIMVAADYPRGHRCINQIATKGMVGGLRPYHSYPLHADRESYILKSIVEGVGHLRATIPKIRDKASLGVVALYGLNHYAIADALSAANDKNGGNSSFSVATRFQDEETTLRGISEEDRQSLVDDLVNYQNWLRTPEEISTLT